MHRLIAIVVGSAIVASVASCRAAAPAAVQPTLSGVESLGLRCGSGVKDNVPSGLFQWTCVGGLDGTSATVLVEGNDAGTASVTLVVDGSPDAAVTRERFGRLVSAVPPLSTAPDLVDGLRDWTGDQQASVLRGVRVSALCDGTQCIVGVVPAQNLLRPLPLP